MLLSNSYPGGPGPLFNQPVYTGWKYTSVDAGLCSTAEGQNYRSFNLVCAGYPVEVGGAPSDASLFPNVQYQDFSQGPQIPTGTPTIPSNACVYAGPTRIKFNNNDAQATVTSPMTTATWVGTWMAAHPTAPAACYTGAGVNGMAAQTVNLAGVSVIRVANKGDVPTTTPATAHGTTGWPVSGQRLGDTPSTLNSVFYLTSGTAGTVVGTPTYANTAADAAYVPAVGDNPSTKSDGAWVPQWTSFSNNGSCDTTTAGLNFKFFNCYVPKGTASDPYSWIKAQVKAAIAANPGNYTTAAQLQTLVNSYVTPGNSSDAANSAPTYADNRSHRWAAAVTAGSGGGCTQSTGVAGTATDTPISAPTNDAMFDSAAGNVHAAPSIDTTCFTATVTLQIGTCNVALVGGICVNVGNYVWGNGTALLGGGLKVAQFTVTFTVKKTTVTTTTVAARSSFPAMNDVTQYQMGMDNGGNANNNTFGANGPGDLYVEGKVQHTMALVADNDVILTGPTGPTDADLTSPNVNQPNPETAADPDPASALEIVGRSDVRVYHPVRCAVTVASQIADTSAGFCPNDITGLYDSVLPAADRPDQQYVNLRPDLAGMTSRPRSLRWAIRMRTSPAREPPNGGGVCGGEFSVDNYNRGNAMGYLTVVGSLGMAHHSAVGEEWPIADALGATSRPYSGYQLAQQFLDGPTRSARRPAPATCSTRRPRPRRCGTSSAFDRDTLVNTSMSLVALMAGIGLAVGCCSTHRVPGQHGERGGLSVRYVSVELAVPSCSPRSTLRFGMSAELPAYLYLVTVGVALTMMDLDLRRLPDSIILPSYVVTVVLLMPAERRRPIGTPACARSPGWWRCSPSTSPSPSPTPTVWVSGTSNSPVWSACTSAGCPGTHSSSPPSAAC